MTTLQSLPAELIILIFDYLGDAGALCSLCLVSKKLCGVAQHLLYRDLFHAPSHTSKCSVKGLFLLTRTVVTFPHLADQVRRVKLDVVEDCGGDGEIFNNYDRTNLGDPSFNSFDQDGILHNIPFKLTQFPNKQDRYSNVAALTSLLLSHTPNIEHLNAVLGYGGLDHLTQVPTKVHRGSLPLSGLRVLKLTSSGEEQINTPKISLNDIVPLLSLPILDKIYLDHVRGYSQAGTSYLTLPSVSLKPFIFSEISFRYSCVDACSTEALLGACKSLKVFRYRFCASSSNQFNPSELRSALDTQRDSLEHLEVSYYSNMEDKNYARRWMGATYGSFVQFRNLKSLDLDQVFLDDLPDLPRSLKRIALQNCYNTVFQTVSHLARDVNQGALPFLGEVYLSTDVLAPGRMLDLPLRGATDLLFEKSCDNLKSLFAGTEVCVRFENNLLSKIADDYSFAFEIDRSGIFWPLIYLA